MPRLVCMFSFFCAKWIKKRTKKQIGSLGVRIHTSASAGKLHLFSSRYFCLSYTGGRLDKDVLDPFRSENQIVKMSNNCCWTGSLHLSYTTMGWQSIACYLKVSRALNREDEDDKAVAVEGFSEFILIARWGGPDLLLSRNFQVPHVAALHDEVSDGGKHWQHETWL